MSRRRTMFQVNVAATERQKTMEMEYSDTIHDNLRMLNFIHPFGEELQAVFVKVGSSTIHFNYHFALNSFEYFPNRIYS